MSGPGKMFHHVFFQEASNSTRASSTSHVYYSSSDGDAYCSGLVNTSKFLKPREFTQTLLPSESPSNCTPTGIDFQNRTYVFYRTQGSDEIGYAIVGAIKTNQTYASGTLQGPSAKDGIFPYATQNYLHLFYKAGDSSLIWSKYDSSLKLIKSITFSNLGGLTGYPSVISDMGTVSSGYLVMNSGGFFAFIAITDFDQMTTSADKFHKIGLSERLRYSPSMAGWYDQYFGLYYLCIFYQNGQGDQNKLYCLKLSSTFSNSGSFRIDGVDIRTSPSAVLNLRDAASGASSQWKNISIVYFSHSISHTIRAVAVDMPTMKTKFLITPQNCGGVEGSWGYFDSGFMKVADPNAAPFAFPSAIDLGLLAQ